MESKKIMLNLITCLTLIMILFSNQQVSAASSTPKIDEYVSITSAVLQSNGSIKVTYKVKKNWSSGSGATAQSISIRYDWPASYRSSLTDKGVTIQKKVGTYTLTLPFYKGVVGKRNVYISYSSGGGKYKERKNYKSIINAPMNTTVHTYTVSKGQAAGEVIVKYVPAIALEFSPAKKVYKIASKSYLGYSLGKSLTDSIGLTSSWPSSKAGQFYRVESTYQANNKLKVYTRVWDSKTKYDKKESPTASRTLYIEIP